MFQGRAGVQSVQRRSPRVRTMGILGVQGMALGNHEFDKGAVLLGIS